MKKIIISLFIFGFIKTVSAQDLAPNQNPNFKTSLEKYLKVNDSLQEFMNTTVQQTYSAPDWYEQRMKRREDRRNFRRQLRLTNAQNRIFRNRWNGGWDNGWNNNWRWNNGWNNNWNFNNNWGFNRPGLGFGIDNFWFWF